MKKGIKWLKEEINELPVKFFGFSVLKQREEFAVIKDDVLDLIDQLDEPEVLSQELPVIPKFVADWIEAEKRRNNSLGYSLYKLESFGDVDNEDVDCWANAEGSTEKFARAWLDGYEVEEEQKYVLSINITDKASKTNYETFLNKRGIFHSMDNESFNSEEFNWSEEEIKDLESGEVLFKHFAVKVEELEE